MIIRFLPFMSSLRYSPAFRFNASFFLFGFLNNCEYVVLLSAALDLVGRDVPKGVILFANIAPALVVKLGWPYLSYGKVQYAKRIMWCSFLTFFGIVVVSMFPSLLMRVLGIAVASFSSGLGEITFLQLSTIYGSPILGGKAVSWFSSGTGASGLVGALLWWIVRGFGVELGLGLTSFIPPFMAVTYFCFLPPPSDDISSEYDTIPIHDVESLLQPDDLQRDSLLRHRDSQDDEPATEQTQFRSSNISSTHSPQLPVKHLTTLDKLSLAKPLFVPYMLPLFAVYFAEYSVNQGVSPTLLYPVPSPETQPILSLVIKKLSDYYPLWQMIVSFLLSLFILAVFLTFSIVSAIFKLPPLPKSLIPLPSAVQVVILCLTTLESTRGWIESILGSYAMLGAALLITVEGYCGGVSYVSAFYHLGQEESDDAYHHHSESISPGTLAAQREFKIACVGFADTCGILAASVFAIWLEPKLCSIQVERGYNLCRVV